MGGWGGMGEVGYKQRSLWILARPQDDLIGLCYRKKRFSPGGPIRSQPPAAVMERKDFSRHVHFFFFLARRIEI